MPAKWETHSHKKSRLLRRCCCCTLQLGCLFIAACFIAACIASIFYSIIVLLHYGDWNGERQFCWGLEMETVKFIYRMAQRAQASYERICTEAKEGFKDEETTTSTHQDRVNASTPRFYRDRDRDEELQLGFVEEMATPYRTVDTEMWLTADNEELPTNDFIEYETNKEESTTKSKIVDGQLFSTTDNEQQPTKDRNKEETTIQPTTVNSEQLSTEDYTRKPTNEVTENESSRGETAATPTSVDSQRSSTADNKRQPTNEINRQSVADTTDHNTKKEKRGIVRDLRKTSPKIATASSPAISHSQVSSATKRHWQNLIGEPDFAKDEYYVIIKDQRGVETGKIRMKRRYNHLTMAYGCVIRAEEAKRYSYIYYWEALQEGKKSICEHVKKFYRDLDITNIVISLIWFIIGMILIFGVLYGNHWMMVIWLATFWFYVIFELVYLYFRVMFMLYIYWNGSDEWGVLLFFLIIILLAIAALKFFVIFCYWWFVFTPAFMMMNHLNNMQLIVSRRG